MKKLLLLLAVLLMTATGTMAQNANRKGFFLELQGGAAFGEVLKYEQYDNDPNPMSKLKGGMVGSFDLGYRWSTSSHFAFDAKLGLWADLADFRYTYNLHIMPGLRWISTDFGSNNMSAYIALNAGAGLCFEGDYAFSIPIELSVGLNFTQNFYGGLVFNYTIYPNPSWVNEADCYVSDEYNWNGYIIDQIYTKVQSYPSLGIRLGYRF